MQAGGTGHGRAEHRAQGTGHRAQGRAGVGAGEGAVRVRTFLEKIRVPRTLGEHQRSYKDCLAMYFAVQPFSKHGS